MNKQIEEMARDLCRLSCTCEECQNVATQNKDKCKAKVYAERAYKKGYRKQSEGEWISGKTPNGQWGYYCSLCSASFVGENAEWIAKEHYYCPHCGAKMKGGACNDTH